MGPKAAAVALLLLAVLSPHGTAAAAASANAISCYTSVPRAPGQRPAATPVAYPRKDGYSACLRYQYRCTVDTATCLASEIGSWKYHYYGSSVQQCRSILSNTARMGVRSVFCCTAERCNAPDPRRDPSTQLLPESWLSRSRPMSPRMAPLSSAAGAAPYAAVPIGKAAAGDDASAGGAVAAPAPMPVAAPAMPFAAAGGASAPVIDQSSYNLACWYSIPAGPGQPQEAALLDAEPGTQFCAKWQMRCTMPSTACSQSDVSARAWRWVYGSVDRSGCDALKPNAAGASSKGVRDGMCCGALGCNKPDSRVDAVTKIRKETAAEAAVAPQVRQQQAQPAVLQPGVGSGAGMQQPVMIAGFGGAGHPGSAWISRLSSSSYGGSNNGGSWGGGASRSSSTGGGGGGWGSGSSSSSSSGSSTKDGSVMGR